MWSQWPLTTRSTSVNGAGDGCVRSHCSAAARQACKLFAVNPSSATPASLAAFNIPCGTSSGCSLLLRSDIGITYFLCCYCWKIKRQVRQRLCHHPLLRVGRCGAGLVMVYCVCDSFSQVFRADSNCPAMPVEHDKILSDLMRTDNYRILISW